MAQAPFALNLRRQPYSQIAGNPITKLSSVRQARAGARLGGAAYTSKAAPSYGSIGDNRTTGLMDEQ